MSNKKRPDRYTVLEFTNEIGIDQIKAAIFLGLSFFVTNSGRRTFIYIFFDEAGKEKYMRGEWLENEQAATDG